jgi:hypothetical protein
MARYSTIGQSCEFTRTFAACLYRYTVLEVTRSYTLQEWIIGLVRDGNDGVLSWKIADILKQNFLKTFETFLKYYNSN